jgi:transposase InsO family protein
LTIYADRGSSMTSKPVAFLLADLGVTQSHSRLHVSDDNPFSHYAEGGLCGGRGYAEGVVTPSLVRGGRVRARGRRQAVLAGVLRSVA